MERKGSSACYQASSYTTVDVMIKAWEGLVTSVTTGPTTIIILMKPHLRCLLGKYGSGN